MSFPSLRQRIALDINRSFLKTEAREHPLMQLFWECTLRCNLRCRHCGSDCKMSEVHPDMPFADFEKVLLRLREVADPRKVLVILSGGEPLVREDIEDCGRRIRGLGFPWGMVTNGRLIDARKASGLIAAGMRSVTVSLDGLEEEHNWMRGTPDSFKYASEAVRILAARKDIAFDVVTCVNKRNFPRLPEMKEYLIGLGLKHWRVFTVFPVGRAASDPQMQLDAEQYRRLMDFIVASRKEGRIHMSYGCEGFLGPYEGKVRDYLFSCQAGLSIASVRVDGAISGCNSIRSDFDQGNIYTDDFIEVWEKRFGVFRDRTALRTGPCDGCKWWKWCLGNGMHLRDEDGRLILCNLERIVQ